MKKDVSSVLVDKNVFDFLNEIKRQLSTNWVFIHFNVFKKIEKCNCFDEYEEFQRLNRDGSVTVLTWVKFRWNENESARFEMQTCRLGGSSTYYLVHSITLSNEKISATDDPDDTIFFI